MANTTKDYKSLAQEARREVLKLIHKAGTSHIASNFSVIDIATVLYENVDLKKDRVVWSKGWSAATIYYFLYKKGVLTREELCQFPNAPYLGLAETTVKGVHVNGGSVGHGLGVAVGMAYAMKQRGETGKVYCIMSDGELNEGSVWEAVMFAAHHKLDNLVAIIDSNGWQAMGRTRDVMDISPQKTFHGFGWQVMGIDGHNYERIEQTLSTLPYLNKSVMIDCKTIKGKGVSFMEDHLLFHYKNVDDECYEKALAELA